LSLDGPPLHIVLVEPEIHWNTGNAGRTCLALGAQLHLIEPLGFSLDDRAVRRAGLDYWPRVQPRVWPDWARFEAELPNLGEAYFLSAEGEKTYWSVQYPRPAVLVFGRETTGLPLDVRERNRSRLLSIPQVPDSVRSLNLSTSVGVVGFEVLRQWSERAGFCQGTLDR
jgi:tRNA (cytidine/uridine-2'-O-)-methyltransferase